MLPLAHVGHYLWILYVLPVLIVIAGILRSAIKEKQASRAQATDTSAASDASAAASGDETDGPDTSVESPKPHPPDGG